MNKLIAVTLLLIALGAWTQPASASDGLEKVDTSERTKRRIDREKQFLYRSLDELNRSQEYVLVTMRALEKQIDAADILEPSRRESDIRSLLEWYQAYAELLGNSVADIEADLSSAYSDEQGASVKPDRYDILIEGYARLGSQLDELVSHLEKLHNRTAERISGLRLTLDYIFSAAFAEERNKNKKPSQSGTDRRNDEMYDRYKDITDTDIAMMQLELKSLGELQRHYAVLIEMGHLELSWITRKTGDCEMLSRLATVVVRDAPAAIEETSNGTIKLYESDIAYFKRKVDDISRARARIVPVGSMRTLDRAEEMTVNYDQMKSRFEHHITWLAEQTSAYRADVVELLKDK